MQNALSAAPADARLFRQGRLGMGWCRARLARTLLTPEAAIEQWEAGYGTIPAAVLAWVALYAGQAAATDVPRCGCCGADLAAPAAVAPCPALRLVAAAPRKAGLKADACGAPARNRRARPLAARRKASRVPAPSPRPSRRHPLGGTSKGTTPRR